MFRDPGQRRRVATPMSGQQADPAQRQVPRQAGTRQVRGRELLAAVHRIDAGLDDAARGALAGWARDFYQAEFADIPLGLVAQCFLGPPFVDHRMDLAHDILEHYAPADAMPDPFARARMLVRSGAYAFVEVYASGVLVPVRDDGTTVA